MFAVIDRVPDKKWCSVCRQALSGDPDDQPFPPLGPMCGECYRSQQMDDELEWEADENGR